MRSWASEAVIRSRRSCPVESCTSCNWKGDVSDGLSIREYSRYSNFNSKYESLKGFYFEIEPTVRKALVSVHSSEEGCIFGSPSILAAVYVIKMRSNLSTYYYFWLPMLQSTHMTYKFKVQAPSSIIYNTNSKYKHHHQSCIIHVF